MKHVTNPCDMAFLLTEEGSATSHISKTIVLPRASANFTKADVSEERFHSVAVGIAKSNAIYSTSSYVAL